MRWFTRNRSRLAGFALPAILTSFVGWFGCAGGGLNGLADLFGTPFRTITGTGNPTTPTQPGSGGSGGGGLGTSDRTAVDPCTESQGRKFVRISMQNLNPDDFVHYFLVLVAFVNGDIYTDGAVCPDDVALYTSFGYEEIAEGDRREFGNFCITGPALVYFHRGGQFRQPGATGSAQLASGIAPAQGTTGTFDEFFTSSGAEVPIPNLIVFHNPGSGEGAALKISRNSPAPCDTASTQPGAAPCSQDAFYYVDDQDRLSGSTALGIGSGRRVPSEIQGTGCECSGFNEPWQELAPSRVSANNARCNEFLRGGRIEYFFVRFDENPPFPQLVWRVSDESGSIVHLPDPRAGVP